MVGIASLSVVAFACDLAVPAIHGEAGRLAIGFAVVASALYIGGRIDSAVKSSNEHMDATLGAAAQFGRDSERRRIEAGNKLAVVRDLHPHGQGGKR